MSVLEMKLGFQIWRAGEECKDVQFAYLFILMNNSPFENIYLYVFIVHAFVCQTYAEMSHVL